jgi:hypothetical protein
MVLEELRSALEPEGSGLRRAHRDRVLRAFDSGFSSPAESRPGTCFSTSHPATTLDLDFDPAVVERTEPSGEHVFVPLAATCSRSSPPTGRGFQRGEPRARPGIDVTPTILTFWASNPAGPPGESLVPGGASESVNRAKPLTVESY